MVDFNILKEVEKELQQPHASPFEFFQLKGNLRNQKPQELTKLMRGYEDYSKRLLLTLGKLLISDNPESKCVAVVGPQGIGKTTLVQDFVESLEDARRLGTLEEISSRIRNIQFVPLKYFLDNKLEMFTYLFLGGKENNVIVFDDAQEVFFPQGKTKPDASFFESLTKKLDECKKCLFIFTFSTFGWKVALSKIPELDKHFDDILWLKGLGDAKLREVIDVRLNEFSIPGHNVNIAKVFTSVEEFNALMKNSSNNPRLLIDLTSLAIEESFERNITKVNMDAVNTILSDAGLQQLENPTNRDLLRDKVIYSMLSYRFVSVNYIMRFSGLNRSTIQREVEGHFKYGRLNRKPNPNNEKEFLYGIRKLLRAYLERLLMDRMEEKTEILRDSSWSSDQTKVPA